MSPAEAAQFVATHRDTIDRIVRRVATKLAFSMQETERFAAHVETTLAADQYRIVRNFSGRSAPATYLAVVIRSSAPRSRHATFNSVGPTAFLSELPPSSAVRTPPVARESLSGSEWRVLASGVVIGTAHLEALDGLLAATLVPTPAYTMIATAAQALSQRLRETSYWAPGQGDLAADLAARWSGATLCLTNLRGESVPAASIVVVDSSPFSVTAPPPLVVIDFRLTGTVVPAVTVHLAPGAREGAWRPAA